jgi:hypothetical protein
MHYLRRFLKDELEGIASELTVWRQTTVSRRVLLHVTAQRLASLAHLVRCGLASSDPEVRHWAVQYSELSELAAFMTGETDGRATKPRADREAGSDD